MESKFKVESGEVEYSFGVDPDLVNRKYVYISHVIINFSMVPASPGYVDVSIVDEDDNFIVKTLQAQNKAFLLFEFVAPILITGEQRLKITYANPSDRQVTGIIIHSHRS